MLHFGLLVAASSRGFFGGLQTSRSFFHGNGLHWLERGEQLSTAVLGDSFLTSNPVRKFLDLYTHSAGIETGYGFFAPNVPDNYKLIFEIHYQDGRTETQLPRIGNVASGVRVIDFLDKVSEIENPALRELMMRMLATSVWRENPEAVTIRAIYGVVRLPGLIAFQQGERETYDTLFVYDFSFVPSESKP